MINPVVNGTRGAYRQPDEFGLDESGEYLVARWEGTRTEIHSLIPSIVASGGLYTVHDSFTGAADKVEARFPFQLGVEEVAVDNWELFAAEVEKDLLEYDLPLINALSRKDKRTIRDAILNPPSDDDTDPDFDSGDALSVYKYMLDGMRGIPVEAPAMRHTQIVSNQWTIRASFANVNKIISSLSIINLENVPDDLLFSLPIDVSTRDGLVYGWRKKYPTVRLSYGHKVQIAQEFIYGLWPTLFFGGAI